MKKLSKYNQHVLDLSAKLPPITEKQKQWFFEHCFKSTKGYFHKNTVWCLGCGNVFEHMVPELGVSIEVVDDVVCPECGRKLKLTVSKERKYNESWYCTIITTSGGFQICRHFIAEKTLYKVKERIYGCQEPKYRINEAVQNWIDENGKETIVARPTKPIQYIYDAWDFEKPMKICSRIDQRNSYRPDKYDIDAEIIYPIRKVLPTIKRNGYTGRFQGFSQCELFKLLLKDNEAEMLIKTRQYDLLRFKHKRGWGVLPFSHSVKIANRNGYIIKDASMWHDYLVLLRYFNLDTHNAHYVCPDNLKAEHDKLMKRKQRIDARIAREKMLAESEKWESEYKESKCRYFGICFGNENIVITVIQSVAEIAEEGMNMKHCVYTNGYYKLVNSLILSAKDSKGNRLATIELDLKSYEVVQCRSKCNSKSPFHDEILRLVKDNINLIRQAA